MLRVLSPFFLCLLLVVTGHTAAIARGSAHPVSQMIICSGAAVVTIYVDADGQPTEATYLCPDCALHLLAGLVPQATVAEQYNLTSLHQRWASGVVHAQHHVSQALARAPPL